MAQEFCNTKTPGVYAQSPFHIPFKGWIQIIMRVKNQLEADHVQVVAGGVAFYFFLAIFPFLSALVSMYGLVSAPAEAVEDIQQLTNFLPHDAATMIEDFLRNLTSQPDKGLGLSFAISLLLSLWSARKGVTALFEGINIAYNELDKRHFLVKYGLTYLFTIGIMVMGAVSISLVVVFPLLIEQIGLPAPLTEALSFLRWPLLAVIIATGLSIFYKVAPHRRNPRIQWVGFGAAIATSLWIAGSIGFSYYVDNFGGYNKTYGSFAAVIIMLLWLLLTAYIILLGAEINSEMEHQTSYDTTIGDDLPLGERNAYFADRVANHD
ncbi:MAG: YihY/virulence factor BrkB family protein [Pseudomonadota bacterium]|nr:YihY/virulence factor BrkB family protein [Pseudomonadota bacterium]